MANKKRNKKINNKQKTNNNNKYNKNQKNPSKSRQNSDQSYDSSFGSEVKITPKTSLNKSVNNGVDVFGNSDKRLDLDSIEKTSSMTSDSTSKSKATQSTNYSPKGLNNLGNTCYLNSVLQIVSETHILFDLLNERSNDGCVYKVKALKNVNDWSLDRPFDEELETTLGQCFPLTQSLISFMREMRANGCRTVNPGKVLNTIRKDWTQFDGWAQQDSHELLRCLLDSLKCKEVKRQRRAIMNQMKNICGTDPNSDDHNLDDDAKARIKSFSTFSYLTPIDAIFGGQLLASVCCDVCHNKSLKFEPFFDLSLPLTHLTNRYSNVLKEKNDSKNIENQTKNIKSEEDLTVSTEDNKKLTPKERRQQRQQKKAAKREHKLQKKANNTINIDTKDNSDLICDKNDENIKQQINTDEEVWPQVEGWDINGDKIIDNIEEEDNTKDSFDEQNISDCNPDLNDSHENLPKESEDWTNSWVQKTTVWTETETPETQENCVSEDDFIMEPLLGDFDEKLRINSDITDWDVKERTDVQCNGADEDEDVLTFIDMLYENNDNKNNVDNEWRDDGWPIDTQHMGPVFGPQLPPQTSDTVEVVDEDSDEYKAQELDFQSTLDNEAELLMSSISDREKLDLKHTATDPSNNSSDFDPNSETIKRIIDLSLETISENNGEKLPNFDLLRLLSNFTAIERLSGSNKYFCEMCTKIRGSEKDKQFTNATKRALIALPPPVLTLHLKRFEADGYRRSISLKKISTFVSFPLTFDLSPFVSKIFNYLQPISGQSPTSALIYGLYGVVEHSGSLRSGHYTAYVKFRPNNKNQIKRFVNLEPFLPKVGNVLKMIENKFFTTNDDNCSPNGYTNGSNVLSNGSLTNGTIEGDHKSVAEEIEQEFSCSATHSDKWFHISDTSVTSSSVSAVLKSNAYILFYERIA